MVYCMVYGVVQLDPVQIDVHKKLCKNGTRNRSNFIQKVKKGKVNVKVTVQAVRFVLFWGDLNLDRNLPWISCLF